MSNSREENRAEMLIAAEATIATLTAQLAEARWILKRWLHSDEDDDQIALQFVTQTYLSTPSQPARDVLLVRWGQISSDIYDLYAGALVIGGCYQMGSGLWIAQGPKQNHTLHNTLDAAKSALITALNGG